MNLRHDIIVVQTEGLSFFEIQICDLRKNCALLRQLPAELVVEAIEDIMEDDYMLSNLELAYEWLTEPSESLLSIEKESEKDDIRHVFRLVELYGIASRLGCHKLENNILDAFGARDTCSDSYPSRRFIKSVYKHTYKYSALRRYVADTFVFKSRQWKGDGKDCWIKLHKDYGNRNFVADVLKAEKATELEDPNCRPKCYYHYHFTDKACT